MTTHRTLGMMLGLMAVLLWTGLAIGGDSGKKEYEKAGSSVGSSAEQVNLQEDQIREMQSLLKDAGYEVGAVDGVIGQETEDAIRQFQNDNGLEASGSPNKETLRALAPTAEKQEFFGLSPEFGEQDSGMNQDDKQQKMEEKPQKSNY